MFQFDIFFFSPSRSDEREKGNVFEIGIRNITNNNYFNLRPLFPLLRSPNTRKQNKKKFEANIMRIIDLAGEGARSSPIRHGSAYLLGRFEGKMKKGRKFKCLFDGSNAAMWRSGNLLECFPLLRSNPSARRLVRHVEMSQNQPMKCTPRIHRIRNAPRRQFDVDLRCDYHRVSLVALILFPKIQ